MSKNYPFIIQIVKYIDDIPKLNIPILAYDINGNIVYYDNMVYCYNLKSRSFDSCYFNNNVFNYETIILIRFNNHTYRNYLISTMLPSYGDERLTFKGPFGIIISEEGELKTNKNYNIMAETTDIEIIRDSNGNALAPGERLLVFSKHHKIPFYVVVRRNIDNRLCIDIDGKETLIADLIEPSQTDYEITIPLSEYQFKEI